MKTLIMPDYRITRQGEGNGNTHVSGEVTLRSVESDNPLKEAPFRFSFQLKNHEDMTDRQILEVVEGFLKAAQLPTASATDVY